MNNELIVCRTCLSTDRSLFAIKNIQDLLLDVNLDKLIHDCKGGVCWECKRIIVKFSRFRKQVELAQNSLLQVEKQQDLKCLSNLTYIVSNTHTYSVPHNNTINNKIDNQPVDLKQEATDADGSLDNYDNDNTSIKSDFYVEESDTINNSPKEIKQEAETNNTSHQSYDDTPSVESEDATIKLEIKPISQKKEVRKESETNKKKVKKLPTVKNKRIIVNPDIFVNKEDYNNIKANFIEVEFTEEEMMKIRDEKRCHPNFKMLPYNCDSCVLGFKSKENYELHKKKKHNASIGPHTCPVCQVCFASSSMLTEHIKQHYHCYRCKMCTFETSVQWAALRHSRSKHRGDSENSIHCKTCSYVAKCREELAEHVKKQHSLICKECGAKFKGPETLRKHKRRTHGTVHKHKCDTCPRTFRSHRRLEAHTKSHGAAAAARLAYCTVCNVQYKNVYVYRNHLVYSANHSENRIDCEECGKSFGSKVYYKQHYAFYHQKDSKFKCEICDRLFISKWKLQHHRQIRHGAERPRTHACDKCPKKFHMAVTLRGHQLTHSSQRSFMCDACGDTFKQRAALYMHTRLVHRGFKRQST